MAIVIAARYSGPANSANGGYCAGVLARHLSGPVQVTLRKRPPLERELTVAVRGERAELLDGDELIAEAESMPLELACPSPPTFEEATELSRHYVGHREHHYPTCFGCGPARIPGDGLRIFPGALEAGGTVAAPFQPDRSLADERGVVKHEIVWAALDCAGYFAAAAPDFPVALLGRICADVSGDIHAGERCVVLGFPLGRDGRKLFAGTAIYDSKGQLRGRARQTWICLGDAPSSLIRSSGDVSK